MTVLRRKVLVRRYNRWTSTGREATQAPAERYSTPMATNKARLTIASMTATARPMRNGAGPVWRRAEILVVRPTPTRAITMSTCEMRVSSVARSSGMKPAELTSASARKPGRKSCD